MPSYRTHFLNAHYVTGKEFPFHVQRDLFEKQLKELSSYCNLVSPEDAVLNLHQNSEPLVSLTFDDGFDDVYHVVAPVLRELKLRAIFFINPSSLEYNNPSGDLPANYESPLHKRFMSKAMILKLHEEGHIIGSHGLTHKRLDSRDSLTLIREICDSKIEIEKITSENCNFFAYPFGGINDLSNEALTLALNTYKYVFSSIRSNCLFSFEGKVINRRHVEGDWPVSHIRYFLSGRK